MNEWDDTWLLEQDFPFMDGPKGPHDSTSPIGQLVHDHLGGREPIRVFSAVDDDLVRNTVDIHKRTLRILRRIEHKEPGQPLKRSQADVYTLYAEAIAALVGRGTLDDESGVFVLELDTHTKPFKGIATRVWWDGSPGDSRELSGERLKRFLSGLPAWRD